MADFAEHPTAGGEWPRTVAEAVDRLLATLTDEEKRRIAAKDKSDLIDLHLDLGVHIRNEFGIHAGNDALLWDAVPQPFGAHPDNASDAIIESLWLRLQRER